MLYKPDHSHIDQTSTRTLRCCKNRTTRTLSKRLPEDLPHERFATKKIRHTTNVTENLGVSVGQMFATVPMWKIRHSTVTGWGQGGWVGRVGVWGRGFWVGIGGLGWGVPNDPNSTPLPHLPRPNPPDPNLSPLCGESSTSALLQTFVRRLRSNSRSHSYVSLVVWRIFFVANLLWRIFYVANPLATVQTSTRTFRCCKNRTTRTLT